MKEADVLRYLYLAHRKSIILTSGINWKPEYEEELEKINKELSVLRILVDEEHRKREQVAQIRYLNQVSM